MNNVYNPFSLNGKTILVTGASSGIGKTTAIECSKMGAKIVACGRNKDRLNETMCELSGEGHSQFAGDLTEPESIKSLIETLDKIDGLVLCAGMSMMAPIQFATPEKVETVFRTNTFSTIELLRMLYKKKIIAKKGSVVIVASIGGNSAYTPGNTIYGMSKAAVNTLMKYAAIELAPRSIRVNSVCPGMVETPLINSGIFSDEDKKSDIQKYPLKRYGIPEDVAYGIIYLLSDASSWVTGEALTIDGGLSLT